MVECNLLTLLAKPKVAEYVIMQVQNLFHI